MAQIWHDHWPTIIPGAFFVLAIVFTVLEKGDIPLKRKFPKVRTWLLFGLTVALFLLWYNVGMYFWEMGLRPVLLVLFGVFAVLFALHVKGSLRKAGKNTMRFISYLFLNLIPGWYLGTTLAGVFQTLYWKGPEGVSQAMVKIVSQLLLLGVVVFVAAGFLFGGDGKTGTEPQKKNTLMDELDEIEREKKQRIAARLQDQIRYRDNLARLGRDTSYIDAEIRDLKNKLEH